MSAAARRGDGRAHVRVFLALVMLAEPLGLSAQTVTVRAADDLLRVRAAGLAFIEGPLLDRLRDGRSVRLDFELTVLEKLDGPLVARGQHSFNLSYDLWEQRFAVTRVGTPPRSISHLTARDAEAWCLQNVTIPLPAMGRFRRDVPFWVRLEYRIPDSAPAADPDDSSFTLRRLIEVLSRRTNDASSGRSMVGGPFRLSN